MALITDNWVNWWQRSRLPDSDYLANRMFVCDGVSPNTVWTGTAGQERRMGVAAPAALGITQDTSGSIGSGTKYTYGLRWRVVDAAGRTLRSSMTLQVVTASAGSTRFLIPAQTYPYSDDIGDGSTLYLDVYRSKSGITQLLYLLTTVSSGSGYNDTGVADGDLVASDTYDTSLSDENWQVPACQFVRAWRGKLVMGRGGTTGNFSARRGVHDTDRDILWPSPSTPLNTAYGYPITRDSSGLWFGLDSIDSDGLGDAGDNVWDTPSWPSDPSAPAAPGIDRSYPEDVSGLNGIYLRFENNVTDELGRHSSPTTNGLVYTSNSTYVAEGSYALDGGTSPNTYAKWTDNLSDFAPAGDFTIDFWFYISSGASVSNPYRIFGTDQLDQLELYTVGTTSDFIFAFAGGTYNLGFSPKVDYPNAKTRVTICRVSSTLRAFVNGVEVFSQGSVTGTPSDITEFYIGSAVAVHGSKSMQLDLDAFRLITGTGYYATDFDPYVTVYSAGGGVHLRLDGNDDDEVGPNRHNVTPVNSPTYTSTGILGGSHGAVLDGTQYFEVDDYLGDFAMGANETWTIEIGARPDSVASASTLIEWGNGELEVAIHPTNGLQCILSGGTYSWGDLLPAAGVMSYYVIVRNGDDLIAFKDGVQSATTHDLTTLGDDGVIEPPSDHVRIGEGFEGVIDEVRIADGQADYTSADDFPDGVALESFSVSVAGGLYVTQALPSNIEGFALENEVLYSYGNDNELMGIAEANGYCYLMHQDGIFVVEGQDGAYKALPLTQGYGCAGHATIADKHTDAVYFYTGRGVCALRGNQVELISHQIDDLIDGLVDHSLDSRAHAIFDPVERMYHLWVFARGDVSQRGLNAPSLCFSFDTKNGEWYMSQLTATLSRIWRNDVGRLVPVVGLPGRVAQLNPAAPYDIASYAGTFTGSDTLPTTGFTLAAGGLAADLNGVPVFILDSSDTVICRRIIQSSTTNSITIYGTWSETLAVGMKFRIGHIYYQFSMIDLGYVPMTSEKVLQNFQIHFEPVVNTQSMTVRLAGLREAASRSWSKTFDPATKEQWQYRGADVGLRSRSFHLTVDGVADELLWINGVEIVMQETQTQ